MKPLREGSYNTVPSEDYGTPKELWGFRTRKRQAAPKTIAAGFLRANHELLGLTPDLRGVEFQKKVLSLGANHLIFQQIHDGRRIHRAYVSVHMDREGRIFLAKNRALPQHLLPTRADFRLNRAGAIKQAKKSARKKNLRVAVQDTEEMWFPKKGTIHPAWRVRLAYVKPKEEWIVYLSARTGRILSKRDNLCKAARGRALVFDPSRSVTLWGLKTNGRLEGTRVTTAPTNPKRRVRRTSRNFLLESTKKGFEEVMVYYHIDSAIRHLERLGFRGARAVFKEPVRVNVNGTTDDNSWYSPFERLLTFGTGDIDDAEDGETIIHELGHALQDAICPDFGQSKEAAAMGEGFGDYFAASLFADKKPERYRPCVMSWDGLLIGLQDPDADPPCLRRLDWDWTYDDFNPKHPEHFNGEIWSATLWDIRERLGRETADRIIVESHFQLDGFTTFARGARAILDADRHLNGGKNRSTLRRVFGQRKIGPI
jgi:Zn-dependent metalloprotease